MPPIIDLIIRIKNGYLAGRRTIYSPYSKFREAVLKKLVELKYIKNYEVLSEGHSSIEIELAYNGKNPEVRDVRIFSKPGGRHYIARNRLKPVLGGLGHAFLSTSKGILTNDEARKQNVGGELLFYIW